MTYVTRIAISVIVVLVCSIIWVKSSESGEESIDALYQQTVELTQDDNYENAFEDMYIKIDTYWFQAEELEAQGKGPRIRIPAEHPFGGKDEETNR